MIAAKKIVVVILIAVLVSSVLAGSSSMFSGRPSSPSQDDLNIQLNDIVDFCMKSLPSGIPDCDNQLRDIVAGACNENNNQLDVCRNGKTEEYYKIRSNAELP